MGGTPRSARTALRLLLSVVVCVLPPCVGVWAQPFPLGQSPEPPVVGAPPVVTEAPIRSASPADPPTPFVSIHVRAPATAAPEQEVDYRIFVENQSRAAAHHVQVRVPAPANAVFVRASPEPAAREPQIVWDLGSVPAGTSREILLTLKPGAAGDLDLIARVQFEHGQSVRTHVGAVAAPTPPAPTPPAPMPPAPSIPTAAPTPPAAPPMPPLAPPTPPAAPAMPPLAPPIPPPAPPMPPAPPTPPAAPLKAELRLRKTADQSHALLNDFLRFQLEVANVGTAEATEVLVEDSLPTGLRYEPDAPSAPVGNLLTWTVGALAPGATRRFEYKALATAAGDQENQAQATAAGGLRVNASYLVHVTEPKMTVTMTGPSKQLLGRPAKYQITVANTGTGALTGVEVLDELPAGARVVGVSDNGRQEGNRVHWILGEAPAGFRRSVTVELTADKEGEVVHLISARADRGLTAKAEAKTLFEGAAGLRVEIDKSDDPLPVGHEGNYTVHITNRGTGPAKDLQLTVTAPPQLQVLNKDGPTEGTLAGQTLTFTPLAALDAGKDATYKIHVKALRGGEVKLLVELKSADLATPLHEEETTTIFGDSAPAPAATQPPPLGPPAPVPGTPP